MKKALPILFTVLLAACSGTKPPASADAAQTPQSADEFAYPAPDAQSQINQLGIQVSRLEQQLQALQTRVQQLERRSNVRPKTAVRPRTAATGTSSISADEDAQNRRLQQYADQTLQRAQSQYQNGQFTAAATTLRGFESGGDGSDTARRSMHLLMQSHQRLNNCESVINIGNRFLARFRTSREAPEALFAIGQCQYNMQQRDIAKTTWQKLVQTYPDSPAARRAYQQLNKK